MTVPDLSLIRLSVTEAIAIQNEVAQRIGKDDHAQEGDYQRTLDAAVALYCAHLQANAPFRI